MLNRVMFFGLCFVLSGMLLEPATAQVQDHFQDAEALGQIHKYLPGDPPTAARPYFKLDSFNIPIDTFPNVLVNGFVRWTIVANNNGDQITKYLLAEWSPNSPVTIVQDFEFETDPMTVGLTFSFQAPVTPGTYRIRLAMTWGTVGIQKFFGDGPFSPNPGSPGVSDYIEATIVVKDQPECGDGVMEGDEVCDDGNVNNCDSCSNNCTLVTGCGDGVKCGSEGCDDGNTTNCDGCRGDCSDVEDGCGDGFVCGNEVCDDGNTRNCDNCRGDCSAIETGCGDGFVCGTEVCDDGNTLDCDTCQGNCMTIITGCGDGVICPPESCDDGNILDGDTCSSTCTFADFEYECVIRSALSPVDHVTALPASNNIILPGDSVFVEFWATDSGTSNPGIAAAYADLDYPEDLFSYNPFSITHTTTFSGFPEGVDDGFIIDELGGTNLDSGFGVTPEWTRIAYAEFTADKGIGGTANFEFKPALEESSAYARGLVPTNTIVHGTCSVFINATCPCIFDLDNNCNVGGGDLGLFAPCWSLFDTDAMWDTFSCGDKDFDCNGRVSGGDLGWFAGGWNRSCSSFVSNVNFPPCRACIGSVACSAGAPARSGEVPVIASLMLDTQSSPADSYVLLSLDLRELPSQDLTPSQVSRSALGPVKAGQHVFAEVWAQDTSLSADGLTAVFTDVHFDPSEFVVVSATSSETFTLFSDLAIDEAHGVVRGVGGATMDANQGDGAWIQVGVVELKAIANITRPVVSLLPSPGEAISRYGQGLVLDHQIRVLPNQIQKTNGKSTRLRN